MQSATTIAGRRANWHVDWPVDAACAVLRVDAGAYFTGHARGGRLRVSACGNLVDALHPDGARPLDSIPRLSFPELLCRKLVPPQRWRSGAGALGAEDDAELNRGASHLRCWSWWIVFAFGGAVPPVSVCSRACCGARGAPAACLRVNFTVRHSHQLARSDASGGLTGLRHVPIAPDSASGTLVPRIYPGAELGGGEVELQARLWNASGSALRSEV